MAFHLARQPGVERDEGICLQLSQCQVLRDVGFCPTQLLGEVPCPSPKHSITQETDRQCSDAREPVQSDIRGQISPLYRFVHGRERLGAQERRCEKLVLGWNTDPLIHQVKNCSAVDNEPCHLFTPCPLGGDLRAGAIQYRRAGPNSVSRTLSRTPPWRSMTRADAALSSAQTIRIRSSPSVLAVASICPSAQLATPCALAEGRMP
jgi:hypothetical protein